ncbi:MAG: ABC-2 type transport system ATP-binding protein [Myxococcota bacterium]|jgi:ABC-2 type transport system ATP-binding protein
MVEVKGLTRYYGNFTALEDVAFDIAEGEIVGLLGLNGAGKSTTLKILAGILAPSSGTVTIQGIDVREQPELLRSRIGYLPEDTPLYVDMTVTSFLRHAGRLKGMSAAQIEARLPEVVRLADLEGREGQVIGTLSHGYKKRVGIAQAIIHDPRLVILDEPISGLDPAQIVEMRAVVRGLATGRAVILSSHILGEISQTCDRMVVINGGRMVAQGTEAELHDGSAHKLVVTVRGDADRLLTWLGEHERVTAVRRAESGDGLAAALVVLDSDAREQLVAELVRDGFGIRLVEDPEDELEEIFLALTKQEDA